jgi:hypothetical protein
VFHHKHKENLWKLFPELRRDTGAHAAPVHFFGLFEEQDAAKQNEQGVMCMLLPDFSDDFPSVSWPEDKVWTALNA